MEPWDLPALLKQRIDENGGIVSLHAHFDKSHVITEETLDMTRNSMEKKWDLWKSVKEKYTSDDLKRRMRLCADTMIAAGSKITRTNVDVDNTVKLLCLEAALEIKEEYKGRLDIQVFSQVLEGALSPEARVWLEKAAPLVDGFGGLPSRDRPREEEHLDYLFGLAKKYGKTVDCHIDQNNDPDERDTEMLARKTIEHGLHGRVNAVHACSLSAQPLEYIKKVAALLVEADMSVIVSPRAMLDDVQLRHKTAPVHNSLAPVPELLEAGVNVALGVDNIHDFFCPFIDGDPFKEMLFLVEACRLYDLEKLVAVATTNGRKVFEQPHARAA